jgi:hypothetical protein
MSHETAGVTFTLSAAVESRKQAISSVVRTIPKHIFIDIFVNKTENLN